MLKAGLFTDPVIIDDISLLRYGNSILCRVVSRDGAVGICVSNDLYIHELIPMECPTSDLKIDENGTIKVPTGPGLGVIIDPDFINKHEVVSI